MSAMFGASTGHFVLESGLHSDRWFDLDALFSDPSAIAASVDELATLLAPFEATAICGPMVGGAFLAQALATRMACISCTRKDPGVMPRPRCSRLAMNYRRSSAISHAVGALRSSTT